MTRTPLLIVGLAATASLGLVACGDDHAGHDSGAAPATASTPATTATTPTATTATTPAAAEAIDAAFIRQMIPHHQGAVEMARLAERKADHTEIKTLAAEIVSAQERELTQLDALAKELGVDLAGAEAKMAADAATLGLSMNEMGMSMEHDVLDDADPFDAAFINEMIVHHEGAIAMAQAQFTKGQKFELRELSSAIISGQQREVVSMSGWREDWYGGSGTSESGDGEGGHSGHEGMDHGK